MNSPYCSCVQLNAKKTITTENFFQVPWVSQRERKRSERKGLKFRHFLVFSTFGRSVTHSLCKRLYNDFYKLWVQNPPNVSKTRNFGYFAVILVYMSRHAHHGYPRLHRCVFWDKELLLMVPWSFYQPKMMIR